VGEGGPGRGRHHPRGRRGLRRRMKQRSWPVTA
jgi:hypothetical protein